MNLRALVNPLSSIVNPNILVTLKQSNGYTIGAGQRQVPSYKDPITGWGQLQALDGSDLKQIETMNIQGTLRALYMYGALAGVMRTENRGGDIVSIGQQRNVPQTVAGDWLITKVLESWSDWTKVCIVKQNASADPQQTDNTLVITATQAGNFTLPHGLGVVPTNVRILMTSTGNIWQTAPPDATNLYLAASFAGVSANLWVTA